MRLSGQRALGERVPWLDGLGGDVSADAPRRSDGRRVRAGPRASDQPATPVLDLGGDERNWLSAAVRPPEVVLIDAFPLIPEVPGGSRRPGHGRVAGRVDWRVGCLLARLVTCWGGRETLAASTRQPTRPRALAE